MPLLKGTLLEGNGSEIRTRVCDVSIMLYEVSRYPFYYRDLPLSKWLQQMSGLTERTVGVLDRYGRGGTGYNTVYENKTILPEVYMKTNEI